MNTNETENNTPEFDNEEDVIRLPAWRHCLEKMREEGVSYGKVFSAEFFEKHMRLKRDTMKFGLAVSEIRRELELSGFYLTGRGQAGAQYVIVPPENNADVMLHYGRLANDVLKRAVFLGSATDTKTLSDSQRRRHEATTERMAIKSVLLQRSAKIFPAVKKTNPELLEDRPESLTTPASNPAPCPTDERHDPIVPENL